MKTRKTETTSPTQTFLTVLLWIFFIFTLGGIAYAMRRGPGEPSLPALSPTPSPENVPSVALGTCPLVLATSQTPRDEWEHRACIQQVEEGRRQTRVAAALFENCKARVAEMRNPNLPWKKPKDENDVLENEDALNDDNFQSYKASANDCEKERRHHYGPRSQSFYKELYRCRDKEYFLAKEYGVRLGQRG